MRLICEIGSGQPKTKTIYTILIIYKMTKRRNRVTRRRGRKGASTSLNSSAYLRCAFAPVDFNAETPVPIPDGSGARVTVKRHKLLTNITNVPANDTYLMFAPIPGSAFYSLSVPTGSPPGALANYSTTSYPDTAALFGATPSINFSDFRYVSNYVELIPTINQFNWSGSVTVWKGYVGQTTDSQGNLLTTGTQCINPSGQAMYVAGNDKGFYAVGTQVGPMTYTPLLNAPVNPIGGSSANGITLVSGYNGIGNLETIFVKITGNAAYTIKVGCCVEYVVNTTSVFYDYSHPNVKVSPSELYAYKQIVANLPLAVPVSENEDFWDRIMRYLRMGTGALSNVPGGVGLISKGINMLL